ncbi:MAG: mevalonate kinase [Colwellia sp.]|jgi:mevalonate kinase
MKILFTLIVLMASVYLLVPKDELQKLTLFLPQNQIEQAAETVLSDVDKKLEQFKAKLLSNKDSRITQLETQLATLQAQLVAQEEKYKLADSQNNEQAQQELPVAQPLLTHAKALVTNDTKLSIQESDKQRAIKRQAYLQDLVERMNKTSLLTLTN